MKLRPALPVTKGTVAPGLALAAWPAGTAKALGLNHCDLDRCPTEGFPTRFGRRPGYRGLPEFETILIGTPPRSVVMLFNCHPPTRMSVTWFVLDRKCLPLPKGSSISCAAVKLLRTS